jgi:hypothetical protein
MRTAGWLQEREGDEEGARTLPQHVAAMRSALEAAEERMLQLEGELSHSRRALVRREQDNAVLLDEVTRARAVRYPFTFVHERMLRPS